MTASPARPPAVDVRRADERFHTRIGWLDSRHSFSFSSHYDPANTHHGLLLVSNDDIVRAGTGFRTHPHQDMEIVTWVLDGELEHKDSEGQPRHHLSGPRPADERRHRHLALGDEPAGTTEDVHFVQMWVPPDTERIDPATSSSTSTPSSTPGGLVPIASGRGHDAAISIRQRGRRALGRPPEARARRSRFPTPRSSTSSWPGASVTLEGAGVLAAGDAARLTVAGAPRAHRGSRRGRRGAHLGDRRRAARRLTGRATDRTREPLVRRSQKRRRDGEVGRRAIARDRNLSDNRDVGLDQLIAAEGRSGARPPEARPAPAGARRWGRARQRPNTWSSRRALTAVASIGPSGSRPASLEMTSGPARRSSVGRPCEPLTRLASSGITSIR